MSVPRFQAAKAGGYRPGQFPGWAALIALALWLAAGPAPLLAQTPAIGAAVDFDTQVVPVLTRMGCNAGACHGAAAGRGGLQLSLYGSRPADDFAALALQYHGRRVDLREPRQSLLLLKPGGELEHGGDHLFELDDEPAQLLAEWVRQGAQRLQRRRLDVVEITPAQPTIEVGQTSLQLGVTARFDDGTRDDVTRWTRFEPDDPAAVTVDGETGLVSWSRPGRHLIVARYLDRVQPIELLVPLPEQPRIAPFMTISPELIDREIGLRLRRLGIEPAAAADDATFLRRLSLDLRGRLATPDEVRQFQADEDPAKRQREIERQLESPEFVDLWSGYLATQLRLKSLPGDRVGVARHYEWLREQIAQDVPWDQTVAALLTANGDTHAVGPAYFYRAAVDPRLQAEFVTESLLGVRLRCANCHDHPLDRWTQDDYHGLAAILAQVDSGRIIRARTTGQVIHPVTLAAAEPGIPGERSPGKADREALAAWLTAPDNPYFARAQVNRVWARLMGRGLVDPVDDLRATNPATHPELLDELARTWQEEGYRLKPLIARICNSQAYQRSSHAEHDSELARRYYAVATPRRLPPAVLADAIDDVTGVASAYPQQPEGRRAVAIYDGALSIEPLDLLGRCLTGEGCAAGPAPMTAGLRQQLHLLNGAWLNAKLQNPQGRLARRIAAGATVAELLDAFHLHALGYPPTPDQKQRWLAEIEDDEQASQVSVTEQEHLQDWLWGLLTCREFSTNH